MAQLQVQQIECANCGAKIDIRCGLRSRTFACEYCGAVCQNDQVVSLQNQQEIKEKYAPKSFLKLGMKGHFLGREYQVVGRIRLMGKDYVDTWDWDEWFLMSDTGYPLWLQEDENGYTLFRVFVSDTFIDPYNLSDRYFINGEAYTVEESDFASIEFIEGELTWKSHPGETVSYVDLRKGINRFSIEYTTKEVQYLKGKTLKFEEIKEAFGDMVPEKAIKKAQAKQEKKDRKMHWGVIAGLMIVLGAFAALAGFSFVKDSGNVVFEGRNIVTVRRLGEFEFNFKDSSGKPMLFYIKKGPVMSFKFRTGSFPWSSNGNSRYRETGWWVSAELYKKAEEGKEDEFVTVINSGFWKADGIDEGESWYEESTSDTIFLKGIETGHNYYLKFTCGANDNVDKYYNYNIPFEIEVREGAWNPFPFKLYAFLIGGIPLLIIIIMLIIKYSNDD
ncbi:MAG: DUF4178 domain-containing protein [Deltaproteobacteria bacterium]|nr:DUF4178 domain-containing protein [Deltaproteobacteria bacterium]